MVINLPERILIIGDTHITNIRELSEVIIEAINQADWVIHTGDYARKELIDDLKESKGDKFQGVYGNADPLNVRETVPAKVIIKIQGKKIAITHPATGGSSSITKSKVISEFLGEELDVIIYGHTHEAFIEKYKEILLINPGRGYIERYSSNPSGSFIILEIDKELTAEIKYFNH